MLEGCGLRSRCLPPNIAGAGCNRMGTESFKDMHMYIFRWINRYGQESARYGSVRLDRQTLKKQ